MLPSAALTLPRALIVVALVVCTAVAVSALSAALPPEEVPAYASGAARSLSDALLYGAWTVTLVGTVVALVLLARSPRRATPLLAAGTYAFSVGSALVAYGVSAFGGDDAGMIPTFIGGPLVLCSGIVAIGAGMSALGQPWEHRSDRRLVAAVAFAVATGAWLWLRGPSDWQGPMATTRLHGAPLLVAVAAVAVALADDSRRTASQ